MEKTADKNYLKSALKSYRSAFLLADHIAATYESDEARLFLTKIKYLVHDDAIETALSVFTLTGDVKDLEQAYFFDQQNKASSLSLALHQNAAEKSAGISEVVNTERSSLRSAITRLSFKAAASVDAAVVSGLNNEITDHEIRLSRLNDSLKSSSVSLSEDAGEVPSVHTIQQLLDDETTLLSYHLSEKNLLVFCISKKEFRYVKQTTDSSFFTNIKTLLRELHNVDGSRRYEGFNPATALYEKLIGSISLDPAAAKRLLIVPDDELSYLPFEALQPTNGKYLVESSAVQYLFSTALLHFNEEKKKGPGQVLAFAPFTATVKGIPALPYSREEVEGLPGEIFIGAAATKSRFLQEANKYDVIQLATHAAANDLRPEKSYISFYPGKSDSDQLLFSKEIYDLRLDSVDLVILSACETGDGQLVRGEGLMSLNRAFAYAGCPNMITSLWQATDKTTAFITKRLHRYLDEGDPKDIALQKAKNDLLKSNDFPPQLKTPNYWSHLVFSGNYTANKTTLPSGYLILMITALVAGLLLFLKKTVPHKTGPGGFSKGQQIIYW